MRCRPVSSRPMAIHLRAVPFNFTVVQAYTPTSDYNDNEVEEFYDQLQNVIDQTPKKDTSCYSRRLECRSHHHKLCLNREGRWGTTDDFKTCFPTFFLFSTALWDLVNSRSVHSVMLSSHLFFCLPCRLPLFTVPCKMVLARPDEQETCPHHCSFCFFTMVRRSSWGPIACWIMVQTSSLVTWSLYEMRSILR